MNSNNLISNTELRTLYPTSLNTDADKIPDSQMNEAARKIELWGTLEMNINTNFTGTFFFFNSTPFYVLSSGIISILAGQNVHDITCTRMYIYIRRERDFIFSRDRRRNLFRWQILISMGNVSLCNQSYQFLSFLFRFLS